MVMQLATPAMLAKQPMGFAVFILVMVLLLGAPLIYGEMAPQMNTVLFIYLFMLVIARQAMPKTEHKAQTIPQSIPIFLIFFVVSVIVMLVVQPMMSGVLVASTLEASIEFVFAFGLLHAFTKAYIEEEVFRARLSLILGEAGQAIAFGLFHFAVLFMLFGWSPLLLAAMAWLTALGYLWGRIEDRFGLAGSTGSHFGYNVVVMGLAVFLFGAAVA